MYARKNDTEFIENLKSNMDRFIVPRTYKDDRALLNLKSNMDRFIEKKQAL